ncbi:MAG: apolipoprotein N-acyltransferase [Weeksellaceae bacterium]
MLKYIFWAVLSGLILALGWPSHGFPILLFFGFVPLLFMESQISGSENIRHKGWKIFGLAYLAFFVWNAIVIWWLHYAQEVNSAGELQNSWISYAFPVLANSLLMSIVFHLFYWVKKRTGLLWGLIFLPAMWMSFEKFHLGWEMTWPWFNLGNGFANFPKWVQWYEYTGTFGGTLWVWVANLFTYYYLNQFFKTKNSFFSKRLLIILTLWIGLPIGISYIINATYTEKGEEITAIALQPKLDPYTEKYSRDSFEIVDDLIRLAQEKITPEVQFVVAPETAFPGPGPGLNVDKLQGDYLIQQIQRGFAAYPDLTFISGVELMRFYPYEKLATKTAAKFGQSDTWYDVMNAAIQFNKRDSIQYYYKSKLVVGVEHFPYMSVLKPLLGDIMLNFGGTVRTHLTQKERSVFVNSQNPARIAPIICYESIYGEFTNGYVKNGANVLFIMTNDSWWGHSDGHVQLLQYGALRAIETRRDIVRSANSGVSAFINQKGEITSSLPYDTQGALIGKASLNDAITFYVQYGDYLARIAIAIMIILLIYSALSPFLVINQKKRKI